MSRVTAADVLARVAVLEVQQATTREDLSSVKTDMIAVKESLTAIRTELTKYRSTWGGIALVISAVWLFVSQFGGPILKAFRGIKTGE